MGPRPFGRGRESAITTVLASLVLLQWGRDLSVAEGQPWRAGCTTRPGFNGAATFRSRKATHSTVELAGGCQGFNGAATFRSRKVVREVACPPPIVLQWGRDLSVAEGAGNVGRGARHATRASMGPRPFGRGRVIAGVQAAGIAAASMGPRPFGRGRCGNT